MEYELDQLSSSGTGSPLVSVVKNGPSGSPVSQGTNGQSKSSSQDTDHVESGKLESMMCESKTNEDFDDNTSSVAPQIPNGSDPGYTNRTDTECQAECMIDQERSLKINKEDFLKNSDLQATERKSDNFLNDSALKDLSFGGDALQQKEGLKGIGDALGDTDFLGEGYTALKTEQEVKPEDPHEKQEIENMRRSINEDPEDSQRDYRQDSTGFDANNLANTTDSDYLSYYGNDDAFIDTKANMVSDDGPEDGPSNSGVSEGKSLPRRERRASFQKAAASLVGAQERYDLTFKVALSASNTRLKPSPKKVPRVKAQQQQQRSLAENQPTMSSRSFVNSISDLEEDFQSLNYNVKVGMLNTLQYSLKDTLVRESPKSGKKIMPAIASLPTISSLASRPTKIRDLPSGTNIPSAGEPQKKEFFLEEFLIHTPANKKHEFSNLLATELFTLKHDLFPHKKAFQAYLMDQMRWRWQFYQAFADVENRVNNTLHKPSSGFAQNCMRFEKMPEAPHPEDVRRCEATSKVLEEIAARISDLRIELLKKKGMILYDDSGIPQNNPCMSELTFIENIYDETHFLYQKVLDMLDNLHDTWIKLQLIYSEETVEKAEKQRFIRRQRENERKKKRRAQKSMERGGLKLLNRLAPVDNDPMSTMQRTSSQLDLMALSSINSTKEIKHLEYLLSNSFFDEEASDIILGKLKVIACLEGGKTELTESVSQLHPSGQKEGAQSHEAQPLPQLHTLESRKRAFEEVAFPLNSNKKVKGFDHPLSPSPNSPSRMSLSPGSPSQSSSQHSSLYQLNAQNYYEDDSLHYYSPPQQSPSHETESSYFNDEDSASEKFPEYFRDSLPQDFLDTERNNDPQLSVSPYIAKVAPGMLPKRVSGRAKRARPDMDDYVME